MRNQFLSLSGFVHPLRTGAFGAVEFQPSASQPACLHRVLWPSLEHVHLRTTVLSRAQQGTAGQDRALQRKALPLPSDQLTYGESDPGCALLSLGAERLIYREGPASQEQILSGQILPSKGLAHPPWDSFQ